VWLKKDIYKEASRRALAEIADFIRAWEFQIEYTS
jgi:hypothetical protein